MAKFVYLTLICMCMSISLAHQGKNQPWYAFLTQPFLAPASICSNATTTTTTTQASYLTNILALINTFQVNSTYNEVLRSQSVNFIAYIKNPANQALLYSNCAAFVSGVKTAKLADNAAQCTKHRIADDIANRISQVARTAAGTNGRTDLDLDSGEKHGNHC